MMAAVRGHEPSTSVVRLGQTRRFGDRAVYVRRAPKRYRQQRSLAEQRDAFLAECPPQEIIAIIYESQRLQARLFEMVHAIHSNGRRAIDTVTAAIAYIGIETTRSLVRSVYLTG